MISPPCALFRSLPFSIIQFETQDNCAYVYIHICTYASMCLYMQNFTQWQLTFLRLLVTTPLQKLMNWRGEECFGLLNIVFKKTVVAFKDSLWLYAVVGIHLRHSERYCAHTARYTLCQYIILGPFVLLGLTWAYTPPMLSAGGKECPERVFR